MLAFLSDFCLIPITSFFSGTFLQLVQYQRSASQCFQNERNVEQVKSFTVRTKMTHPYSPSRQMSCRVLEPRGCRGSRLTWKRSSRRAISPCKTSLTSFSDTLALLAGGGLGTLRTHNHPKGIADLAQCVMLYKTHFL